MTQNPYLAASSLIPMIQRKQTLWLLFSMLFMLLCFYLPFGVQQTPAGETNLSAQSNNWLAALSAASALFSLILVFLFRNRILQMRLTLLNMLLSAGTGAFMFYLTTQTTEGNRRVLGLLGNQLFIGLLLPVFSLLFLFLAWQGIRADERLVKSTDRLR